VLRAGRRTVYQAFLNASAATTPRFRKLQSQLEHRNIPIQWTDKGRIRDLAGSKEHQGTTLRTSPYPYTPLQTLRPGPRRALLDNVEDPHNVGAILRSAEVFGFRQILLPEKGTPEIYPSVVKVSAGASEFLSITRDHSSTGYVREALASGYTLVVLDAKGTVRLSDLARQEFSRLMLVVGGEDRPVGQFVRRQAHYLASIPQQGRVNSLNASVAAGIAMHALADCTETGFDTPSRPGQLDRGPASERNVSAEHRLAPEPGPGRSHD
jgi:23S rRNA (guanosine2251-2'-O)-methyltransferase